MRVTPMSILAIFAHPDDEIGVGSTLAYYGDGNVLTMLVTASRGEAATIYCPDCATRDTLPQVRTRELECACRKLGIAELRWLNWPDGGIGNLPRAQAVRLVTGLIRAIRPDVVITHPEHGIYPHPDHLAIFEIVRTAFEAAADPEQYPGAGQAWAAARLYARALPQSLFEAAPDLATARVQLNGQALPYYATPDAELDVSMRVKAWADRRLAAWDCHRSQQNPDSAMARLPDGLRRSMAENEHYVLLADRTPLPDGVRDDLLAGLEGWPAEVTSAAANGMALRATLAARRGYLVVCQEFLQGRVEPQIRDLLDGLVDREQEVLYLLAGAMRREDEPPGAVEPDDRVLAQGRACQSTRARLRFLQVSIRHARAWAADRAASAATPEQRQAWEELVPLVHEDAQRVDELMAGA